MQSRYEPRLKTLLPAERHIIRNTLGLPPLPLSVALRPLSQADVVLACLKVGAIKTAEKLVGRTVVLCPPDMRLHPLPLPPLPRRKLTGDDRVITYVKKNNPRIKPDAIYRFSLLRVGMTVGQFRRRGGKLRDIRMGLEEGWLRLNGKKQ